MEQSPSFEANWFAASQEIPRVLWNPKFPHRTHKRPPPIPIPSQPNWKGAHISDLYKIVRNCFQEVKAEHYEYYNLCYINTHYTRAIKISGGVEV
jgi:hypothetical protein